MRPWVLPDRLFSFRNTADNRFDIGIISFEKVLVDHFDWNSVWAYGYRFVRIQIDT